MDVRVKLLSDDVWSGEDDKTGFLSVGVDFSIDYFWKNDRFTFPWCKLVLKNENMRNEDKCESSTNRNMRFLMKDQNIMFGYIPPM